jgi:hypothetical protein
MLVIVVVLDPTLAACEQKHEHETKAPRDSGAPAPFA